MENSYGIGVHNRYELFYDNDEDPLTLLQKSAEKKKPKTAEKENKVKSDKVKAASKDTKKIVKAEPNNKQTDKTNGQVINQRTPRTSDNRVKFSDREERNNRRNRPEGEVRSRPEGEVREGNAAPRFDGEPRGRGRGGFGRGGRGGRGRGRGGRENFSGDFRGKREFDRQSGMVGSGVKPHDKREGSGSFNWGSDKDQIEETLNQPASDHDTSTEATEKPAEEGTAPVPTEDEAPKEEGPKEMTLDEWKAMQKRDKPQFNIRKAGEGENTNQWKKTYVLKKKEDEADEESDDYEEEDEEGEVQHGRRKKFVEVDIQFADSPVRGRGRGRGRGGPRGRGGVGRGGGNRGSRYSHPSRQEAPKMDDEHDFPSLG